jgi:hypothetical protein
MELKAPRTSLASGANAGPRHPDHLMVGSESRYYRRSRKPFAPVTKTVLTGGRSARVAALIALKVRRRSRELVRSTLV